MNIFSNKIYQPSLIPQTETCKIEHSDATIAQLANHYAEAHAEPEELEKHRSYFISEFNRHMLDNTNDISRNELIQGEIHIYLFALLQKLSNSSTSINDKKTIALVIEERIRACTAGFLIGLKNLVPELDDQDYTIAGKLQQLRFEITQDAASHFSADIHEFHAFTILANKAGFAVQQNAIDPYFEHIPQAKKDTISNHIRATFNQRYDLQGIFSYLLAEINSLYQQNHTENFMTIAQKNAFFQGIKQMLPMTLAASIEANQAFTQQLSQSQSKLERLNTDLMTITPASQTHESVLAEINTLKQALVKFEAERPQSLESFIFDINEEGQFFLNQTRLRDYLWQELKIQEFIQTDLEAVAIINVILSSETSALEKCEGLKALFSSYLSEPNMGQVFWLYDLSKPQLDTIQIHDFFDYIATALLDAYSTQTPQQKYFLLRQFTQEADKRKLCHLFKFSIPLADFLFFFQFAFSTEEDSIYKLISIIDLNEEDSPQSISSLLTTFKTDFFEKQCGQKQILIFKTLAQKMPTCFQSIPADDILQLVKIASHEFRTYLLTQTRFTEENIMSLFQCDNARDYFSLISSILYNQPSLCISLSQRNIAVALDICVFSQKYPDLSTRIILIDPNHVATTTSYLMLIKNAASELASRLIAFYKQNAGEFTQAQLQSWIVENNSNFFPASLILAAQPNTKLNFQIFGTQGKRAAWSAILSFLDKYPNFHHQIDINQSLLIELFKLFPYSIKNDELFARLDFSNQADFNELFEILLTFAELDKKTNFTELQNFLKTLVSDHQIPLPPPHKMTLLVVANLTYLLKNFPEAMAANDHNFKIACALKTITNDLLIRHINSPKRLKTFLATPRQISCQEITMLLEKPQFRDSASRLVFFNEFAVAQRHLNHTLQYPKKSPISDRENIARILPFNHNEKFIYLFRQSIFNSNQVINLDLSKLSSGTRFELLEIISQKKPKMSQCFFDIKQSRLQKYQVHDYSKVEQFLLDVFNAHIRYPFATEEEKKEILAKCKTQADSLVSVYQRPLFEVITYNLMMGLLALTIIIPLLMNILTDKYFITQDTPFTLTLKAIPNEFNVTNKVR